MAGWQTVKRATRRECIGCKALFIPRSHNHTYCTEDCKLISRIGTKNTRNNGG